MPHTDTARLLIACDDQPGIVAAVAGVLAARGVNIVSLDQHSTEDGRFFQRTVLQVDGFAAQRPELEAALGDVAERFSMEWSLHDVARRKRVAIFVSKYDHCLMELLWRTQRGELDIDVTMVVSNHPDLAESVRTFGVPFVHIPRGAGDDAKAEMESRQLEMLQGNVDLVVLARYMQILTDDFIEQVGAPVINIHHSFLPAFIGANPYARAKDRGVKLIGATAHYATADLDEGPIIEQDVTRVTHAESAAELQRRGADVERFVLARAVKWHAEDRVIVHGRSTVIL
ncbi:Formyltetrahydrofolate deformylase [Microbacterium esteraromaticum]|uniref:Formyltetrahydrofolate deformylase n=1 Tax=Microbacterium esteraromaticum TaxID=57043 RepID=A0A1R4I9U6_9MICO|nr:formyltetrahydrofolate deformylase [Microbacterium esteraromaticum]SJN16578.1 Formyltetrahydrofolate deformylase [Microbacterium esteraromaticum]